MEDDFLFLEVSLSGREAIGDPGLQRKQPTEGPAWGLYYEQISQATLPPHPHSRPMEREADGAPEVFPNGHQSPEDQSNVRYHRGTQVEFLPLKHAPSASVWSLGEEAI